MPRSTFYGGLPLLTAMLLLGTACGGSNPSVQSGPDVAPETGLRPGDAVQVAIWREPDLSGKFQVSERGVVVFPMLGERRVTGASPDSLRATLVAEYDHYLENPSVEVTILRRISVLGEVRQPGLYPVDATYTVSDALALAGGVGPEGNQEDIRLIRDGQVIRQSLDVATVVGSSSIRAGDQIVVGQKSWMNRNLPVVTSLIGATTSMVVALLLR